MDTLIRWSVTRLLRYLYGKGRREYIPSIILVAQLDPKPVCKGNRATEGDGGDRSDGPRWGEEDDVQNEEE
jgi:hypothetical protein